MVSQVSSLIERISWSTDFASPVGPTLQEKLIVITPAMILIVRGVILIVNTQMLLMGKRADILVRFGERLRELRKAQGYSQEGFAAACELDRTYIGGIERGERNLALRNIEAIAQTLRISLSELMEGL